MSKRYRYTGPTVETRTLVSNRAGGYCERCRDRPLVTFQHRCPRQAGGSGAVGWINLAGNLAAVCNPCHAWMESYREDARRTGWLVLRGFADQLGGCGLIPIFDIEGRGWIITDRGTKRLFTADDASLIVLAALGLAETPTPQQEG